MAQNKADLPLEILLSIINCVIYNLYKICGETPLERVQRFISDNPELKGEKFTYLGRLDPMAEGVLLVASGKDTEQTEKEKFLNLDKHYDFTVLFGFATDSYDVLGKILRVEKIEKIDEVELYKICQIYKGERNQEYPEFSSKVIAARRKSPDTFFEKKDLEPKIINVYDLQLKHLDKLNKKELFGRLLRDISKVQGDFRQHEILVLWKQVLLSPKSTGFCNIANFSAHVSSGTYIRGLVNDLGNTLVCGATTLSIKRTRVGNFRIEDSIK